MPPTLTVSGLAVTVTAHSAFTLPHTAVMTVLPAPTAVTTPSATVATASFPVVQVKVSVVFSGCAAAVRTAVSPVIRFSVVLSSVTPVAGTTAAAFSKRTATSS